MDINELKEKFNLGDDVVTELGKLVQSAEDRVRTDYSTKLKTANDKLAELTPKEKTQQEIDFEDTQRELNELKFKLSAKEKGIDDSVAKYLKADVDLDEFSKVFTSYSKSKQDYVAKSHDANVGLTKEAFKKLGYAEKAKLYTENPTLYAELSK